MKDDIQHIEKLYRDALVEQDFKPSASFKTRIHLLLMFIQVRKILLALLILLGIAIGGYFGYISLLDDKPGETNIKATKNYEIVKVAESTDAENKSLKKESFKRDKLVVLEANNSFNEVKKIKPEAIDEIYAQINDVAIINNREKVIIATMKYKTVRSFLIHSAYESPYMNNISEINIADKLAENKEVDELLLFTDEAPEKAKLFSLSLYASPTITNANIKSYNGNNEYINLRKDNESSALSWSAGGDIQIHLKNWFLQTGINYSVYRNSKNYNYNYQLLDSANSYFNYDTIWVWIYDPPNLEYPVMVGIDTTWVPVYENISVVDNGNNEWSYLEIPVLIGYKINYHKFDFEIATGVSFGFLMNYSGSLPKFPDAEGMEDINKFDGNINKTMYNYILRMGMSYSFTDSWSVLAQPYFKQNLHSVFDNSYSIDQRFSTFGLNVGLRVNF